MRALKIASFAVYLAMVAPLLAQNPAYRVELSGGTTGQIILENDSRQDIEAFHFSAECGASSGMKTSSDILDSPMDTMMMRASHPRTERGGVHPWERVTFLTELAPQQSGCSWKAVIDAVIYADGSYEGAQTWAQFLQARRDGIAASVKYWIDHLKALPTVPLDMGSIQADAEHRRQAAGACIQPTPDCGYRHGRQQVDSNLAIRVEHWKDNPELEYQQTLQFLTRWQAELNGNVALKRLELTFPLPDPLVERKPEVAAAP